MDRAAELSGVSDAELDLARGLLADAARIVVLTGAGVSAESGVPTFRGSGGLWKEHRPEDLATPEAFARDPCIVWEWYAWRRGLVAGCEPNPDHHALARLERLHGGEAARRRERRPVGLEGGRGD